jgi:cytoskeleton protein RodZ
MENFETIGPFLQKAREEKGITLRELADKTKININILRALESDDIDKLPNKTYVRGFVQNYAKILGLSLEEAYERMNNTFQPPVENKVEPTEEITTSKVDVSQENDLTPPLELEEMKDKIGTLVDVVTNKKYLTAAFGVIVVYFVFSGVYGFFKQLSNEKIAMKSQELIETEIKPSDANILEMDKTKEILAETETETEANEVQVQDETATDKANEAIVAQTVKEKIEKEENVVKDEKVQANNNTNGKFPYINFRPAPRETFEIVEDAPEVDDTDLFPANIKNSYVKGTETVFINATSGDTWLSYQVDGEEIKRFVLKEGRTLLLRGENILLFMGNVNVTKIFYNNQFIKINSRTGVKSLIFPKDYASEVSLPLFPNLNGVPYDQKSYKANMETDSGESQNG